MFYLFNCPKRFFSICGVEHYILNDGDEGITKKGGIRIPPRKTFNIFKFLLILSSMPPSWPIMKRPWYLLSPVLLRGKQISGLLVSELRLFCSPILCWLLDGSAHMGLAYNGWWWQLTICVIQCLKSSGLVMRCRTGFNSLRFFLLTLLLPILLCILLLIVHRWLHVS